MGCSLRVSFSNPDKYKRHKMRFDQIFLAHLSQKLIGELIVYPCSVVPPSVVCRRSQFQKSSSPKPLARSKPNFIWSLLSYSPRVGGTKVCSWHLGHMSKMAAKPIYGKNPSKIFFSGSGRPIFKKLGM